MSGQQPLPGAWPGVPSPAPLISLPQCRHLHAAPAPRWCGEGGMISNHPGRYYMYLGRPHTASFQAGDTSSHTCGKAAPLPLLGTQRACGAVSLPPTNLHAFAVDGASLRFRTQAYVFAVAAPTTTREPKSYPQIVFIHSDVGSASALAGDRRTRPGPGCLPVRQRKQIR